MRRSTIARRIGVTVDIGVALFLVSCGGLTGGNAGPSDGGTDANGMDVMDVRADDGRGHRDEASESDASDTDAHRSCLAPLAELCAAPSDRRVECEPTLEQAEKNDWCAQGTASSVTTKTCGAYRTLQVAYACDGIVDEGYVYFYEADGGALAAVVHVVFMLDGTLSWSCVGGKDAFVTPLPIGAWGDDSGADVETCSRLDGGASGTTD